MQHVISGKYRGRKIATGKDPSVRPTTGRVREAIFSMLSSRKVIHDSNILDLFCGWGSLSFEALSHGAKHAFMVDSDYYNLQISRKTAENFGVINDITLICCRADKLPEPTSKCDIVFMDPPYKSDLIEPTLNGLVRSDWLNDEALIVIETEKNKDLQYNENFTVISERTYGRAKIVFLSFSKYK